MGRNLDPGLCVRVLRLQAPSQTSQKDHSQDLLPPGQRNEEPAFLSRLPYISIGQSLTDEAAEMCSGLLPSGHVL